MSVRGVATVLIVTAIMFIMAMAAQVFIDDFLKPPGLFGYLILTTLISGVITSVITEKIDARILD